MAIFRIKKQENFVVFDKGFLTNKNLTAKAKGVLAYLLSLPPDWEVRIEELVRHFADGKTAIYSAIKELKGHGYIIHERVRNDKGTFTAATYLVFNEPQRSNNTDDAPQTENRDVDKSSESHPHSGFLHVDNRHEENPHVDNQPLLKNNITKKDLNKETAAISTQAKQNQKANIAAAFSQDDYLIHDKLTANQIEHLRSNIETHAELIQGLGDKQTIFAAIQADMVNPDCFKKCGNDFLHKLNAVMDAIKKQYWSPTKINLQKIQTKQAEIKQLKFLIKDLESQRQSLKNGVAEIGSANVACRHSFEREIGEIDKKLQPLYDDLQQVQEPASLRVIYEGEGMPC